MAVQRERKFGRRIYRAVGTVRTPQEARIAVAKLKQEGKLARAEFKQSIGYVVYACDPAQGQPRQRTDEQEE